MNKEYIKKLSNTGKAIAPTVLRIGLALVFLWFGTNQIMDPISWVDYIPAWVLSISHLSAQTFVYLNAAFEILFGVALALGFFTRLVAFFLMLHMFGITYEVGYDAIGVRDFGLSVAMIVIWLNGVDFLTLDRFMGRGDSVKAREAFTTIHDESAGENLTN